MLDGTAERARFVFCFGFQMDVAFGDIEFDFLAFKSRKIDPEIPRISVLMDASEGEFRRSEIADRENDRFPILGERRSNFSQRASI